MEPALNAPPRIRHLDEGPAVLVVNTRSRSGREAFETARAMLADRGIPLLAAHALSRPKRLRQVLEETLAAGARRVFVGGGDGTISCAAQVLMGRDVTLGVVPLGTGNDFARSLGIPDTIEAACDVIVGGYTARVDVGLVNGRPFLNAASLGLTTAIAKRLTQELKQRAGKLAYPMAAAAEMRTLQPFHVRLQADTETLELDALQLVVGNGRYHGAGNMVSPEATLDDRKLHVYAITAPSAADGSGERTGLGHLQDVATLARVALGMRSGGHLDHEAVVHLDTRHLTVETDPPMEVNADGENVGMTPMRFEVASAALRVYAPAPPLPQ
ncbi:lipid kinase [Corallococcus sp. CA053C]|uniref:lipid kinase n=1 Tax=Corallococcus sp. CA053C TaxID=2316732 RepID=UPI001F005C56|nr:lipid kinase [Corallococcus sp. CA053C]